MTEDDFLSDEDLVGEAYQVVGQLAYWAGVFDDPAVQHALDVLARMSGGSMLPFELGKKT